MVRMASSITGKAGEYRVTSELLLRGYNPATRVVDDGVDIVLNNHKTLQVKTVTTSHRGFYTVSLANSSWRKGIQSKKGSSLLADYVIIWVVPENVFYILPAVLINGKMSISVGGKTGQLYTEYINKWELLNEEAE